MSIMPVPLENYELPEKLTKDCAAITKVVDELSKRFPEHRLGIVRRVVLGGYVGYVNVYDNGNNSIHLEIINKQVWQDWNDHKIFCVKRKFTHGEDVLTTLPPDEYCMHVVNWDFEHAAIVKDPCNVVIMGHAEDVPMYELPFYKWLCAAKTGSYITTGEVGPDIRRYLSSETFDGKIITRHGKKFEFELDFISTNQFKLLNIVHEYYHRQQAMRQRIGANDDSNI